MSNAKWASWSAVPDGTLYVAEGGHNRWVNRDGERYHLHAGHLSMSCLSNGDMNAMAPFVEAEDTHDIP